MATVGALIAGGCTADDLTRPDDGTTRPDTQLVVSLAVPDCNLTESGEDGEDGGATRATTTPSDKEGKVNSLQIVAFSTDGGTAVVQRPLLVPSKMPVSPDKTLTYEIGDLAPGSYRIYLLANFGNTLDGVKSEGELKQKIIDYTSTLPEPGNLPMVYEPTSSLRVNEAGVEKAATLEASMTIAAVKVTYNIIFDKSLNADIFGNAGLRITGMEIEGVAKQQNVVADRTKTDVATRSITAPALYYNSYTETQGNAGRDNADVIAVSGAGAGAPQSWTTIWVSRGTVYLPERYVASSGVPPTMYIDGIVTDGAGKDGNIRNSYSINLAAYDGNKEEKSMPRGCAYEVVAKVKSLGDAELDATVNVKDWTQSLISASVTHTYLNVSKIRASVTSLATDQLGFSTDGRGGVTFECATKLRGINVIDFVDQTSTGVTLKVNSNVPVSQLSASERVNTARIYVVAGNIRKAIDVDYDITPFFNVTPLSTQILYDGQNTAVNVKEYRYDTNLGGVKLTNHGGTTIWIGGSTRSHTSYSGNNNSSRLLIECTDPTAATGVIKVTAQNDPGTSTTHYFDAYPGEWTSGNSTLAAFRKDLECTVRPALGSYRIYFRAINDWQQYNGGSGSETGEWLQGQNSVGKPEEGTNYPTEYYGTGLNNNNWVDWWYFQNGVNGASDGNKPSADSHRVYIWTQEGETTTTVTNSPVWAFTGWYDQAPTMTGDANNPGWYYYDLGYNQKNVGNSNSSGDRYVTPGTTLMIFHNNGNNGYGYNAHRATHHLDPGIPLFDFEDREGWVLYKNPAT